MPTLVIDRLEPPSSARRARSSDLGRARAADRLAGRTVWCAAALPSGRGAARRLRACLIADGCVPARDLEIAPDEPSFRELAARLDQALRLASAVASRTAVEGAGPFGWREHAMYAEGARGGEALAGDGIGPGDIVVLHDALAAALAEAVRGRGAHVVWAVPLGAAPGGGVAAAWDALRPYARAIDAMVVSWTDPGDRPRGMEHLGAAMPSSGLLAAKEIAATGAEAQALHNRGWTTLLADIVDRDRGECVGGTLHARPAVPAR
jgi:trehalose synthase